MAGSGDDARTFRDEMERPEPGDADAAGELVCTVAVAVIRRCDCGCGRPAGLLIADPAREGIWLPGPAAVAAHLEAVAEAADIAFGAGWRERPEGRP